ncbi:CHAD domain-containing protein [Streptomyces sp. CWNU-1]|uniref:CHAD domain-containing protein n=1 Tax=Streptomyces albipurpureus TaxID=2897419 RepID=A0ABT0V4I1_9ACTN|nr:CHAD domain-containing protein [Streptomyces sp. CWNU-1]MCM2394286.1 CHAD domain-containing protein [Streptomyces sp. CWNU-1]
MLAAYLHARAGDFLRGLRLYGERGAESAGAAGTTGAALSLRMAARRISATLHTFRPLLDVAWADGLRTELAWVSGTLAQEHACTARLERLLEALGRLSGTGEAVSGAEAQPESESESESVPGQRGQSRNKATAGALAIGAARAGALLERQLNLARTRAHSTTLQALGSARLHAVADGVALLASELPLSPAAKPHRNGSAGILDGLGGLDVLEGQALLAEERLWKAVSLLPLARAGHPYNADALVNGLATASAEEVQDTPWHQVRILLRLHRYAGEVLQQPAAQGFGGMATEVELRLDGRDPRAGLGFGGRDPAASAALRRAGRLLDRHRDAAEAAAAATAAARTPRIAPATAYALGVLHADQRHEVEAARFAFHEVWQTSFAVQAGR